MPGSFLASSDLKSMYLHCKIHPDYCQDFGFYIVNASGIKVHYMFLKVPFGLAEATCLMTNLIKPIKFYLHSHGIDASWYLDDSAEVLPTFKQCLIAHNFIMKVLQYSGWQINLEKSTTKPTQSLTYLGFFINTITMVVSAPSLKIARISKTIEDLLVLKVKIVTCKHLAHFLGTVCHLLVAYGCILRISTRACQHQLGLSVQAGGWSSSVQITVDMERELRLTLTYLQK